MGIFDPKVDAQFTPESIPQPEQNGALLGIAQAVGTVADGYFSTRKKSRTGAGSNTLDWAPVHEKMRDIADLRDQGLHRQAAQAEIDLQQLGQQAHFKVAGPEWTSAYETITGRPSEMIGEDPDSFLVSEAMEDTAGWTSAGYMSWSANSDPNMTPKEREDLTLAFYQKKAVSAASAELINLEWNSGGSEQATANLMEDLMPITGLLNMASAHDRLIDLNDTVGAEQAILAIRGKYENAITKSGVTGDAREKFLAPLANIEAQLKLATEVASYGGEKGVKARLISEVSKDLKDYPPAVQTALLNNMSSSDSIVEALAILGQADTEASKRAIGVIRGVVTDLFLTDEQRGLSDGSGGGGRPVTPAGGAIEDMNADDITIDSSGVTSPLPSSYSNMPVTEVHERALRITESIQSGTFSADDLELNRDQYIALGQMVAGAASRDENGQYFNANDIGKMYNGQTEAGIRALGAKDAQMGWEAANQNTTALRSQGSRARQDLEKQVIESNGVFSAVRGENGIEDIKVNEDTLGKYLSGSFSDVAPEVMRWMKQQPGGVTGVMMDPKYSSAGFSPGTGDLPPKAAIAIQSAQRALGTLDGAKVMKETADAITVIEDRTEAFRSMTKEFGTKIGKVMDMNGAEVVDAVGPESTFQQASTFFNVKTSGEPKDMLAIAKSAMGMDEKAQNGILTDFMAQGGVNINPAETAWCAAFVNGVFGMAGIDGTNSLAARSFSKWGNPVDPTEAQMGDIVVLSRGDNAAQGHVGFFQGYDEEGNILILGGNQGNKVSIQSYSRDRLVAMRRGEGLENVGPEAAAEVMQKMATDENFMDTGRTSSPEVEAPVVTTTTEEPDASVLPPELESIFEKGGDGFTAEQAKAVRTPSVDETISNLDADLANSVIKKLIEKLGV